MNRRLLEVVVGICLLASCSEADIKTAPEIEAVQVNVFPSIGKTAKIKWSLSQPHEGYVDYWKKGAPESIQTDFLPMSDEKESAKLLTNLEENTAYQYRIRFGDQADHLDQTYEFYTAPRPERVNLFYDEADNQIDTGLDGHLLFHKNGHPSVIVMIDGHGQVAWYRTSPNMVKVVKLTHRRTLLSIESSSDQEFSDGDRILETNFAGDTLLLFNYGENDFNKVPHHDVFLNEKNQVVYLTQEEENGLKGDGILVLDRNGKKVWEWSTFQEFASPDLSTYVQPWANSIIEEGDHYYVSFRALSQVWKIHKVSGNVEWKLGNNGDFDLDSNTNFLFQHFAHFNTKDELLLFDNGSDNRPYSRILSIRLADQSQSLSPKTNIRLPEEHFSPFMGSVQQVNTEEFLVCSATNGAILQINQNGTLGWVLNAADRIYRCVYVENIFQ